MPFHTLFAQAADRQCLMANPRYTRYGQRASFHTYSELVSTRDLVTSNQVSTRLLLLVLVGVALEAQTLSSQAPATCKVRLAEDFEPMTSSERGANYAASIFGPGAIAFTAALAGANQAAGRPQNWTGNGGFVLRLASAFGQNVMGQSAQYGFEVWLHQDNRYFGSGKHGFGRRLAYALESSVLARRDNGTRTVSLSALGGTAAGAFASRIWEPSSARTVDAALVQFGFAMGIRATFDVMREFSPRVLGRAVR